MKITKDNAENIARNMVGFELQTTTHDIDHATYRKIVHKTYTIGGWAHRDDYAAADSLQKKLRRAIVAVLVEAELPEGTHVAEVRRKYR
jgi:hypothetical protein